MTELPLNPMTATIARMEDENNSNVFAFGVAFPKSTFGDGPRLTISHPVAPGKIIDPALCKDYATKLAEELERRGLMDLVVWTNWPSVAAAIQRVIIEFNSKRDVGGQVIEVIQ